MILTEQAWSIKDLFHGQKDIVFLLDQGGKSRKARWVHLSGSSSQSVHRFRVHHIAGSRI